MIFKNRAAHLSLTLALALAAGLGAPAPRAAHRAQLSLDLLAREARHSTAGARVIVHGTPAEIEAIAARHHLSIARRLATGAVLVADSAEISELAADTAIDHLSGDVPVRPTTVVSNQSTGADQVHAGTRGLLGLGSMPGVNGQGIGVAVIDSGVSPHPALTGDLAASVSLVTGDSSVADAFGHGTHIAGIITGSGAAAARVTPLYTGGIAPGAHVVNVRVLGADGVGLTSDVIAGIDWAIANRARFNIRVINLSVGHPVTEPAATDPLCEAVSRAVSAGIVVVAAAGNSGKTADGTPILGGITSPGNSPYAITVGALNTWQTVPRQDDSLTTYSSRGPTRYDLAVKPDVLAPGNKIVSLEADDSYLAENYAFLHRAGAGSNAYMQLSGTSMAAGVVSGGVALLLQAHPSLTPAQVKLALQTGASYVPDAGLMGGGAGSVNFFSSRTIVSNGLLTTLPTALVGGLLVAPSGAAFWDAGTLSSRLYGGTGLRLLGLLDLSAIWSNPSRLSFGDLNLVGLFNPLQYIPANHMLWGQVADWSTGNTILWGDAIDDPQGQTILWGDTDTTGDTTILWGDSVLTSPDPQ